MAWLSAVCCCVLAFLPKQWHQGKLPGPSLTPSVDNRPVQVGTGREPAITGPSLACTRRSPRLRDPPQSAVKGLLREGHCPDLSLCLFAGFPENERGCRLGLTGLPELRDRTGQEFIKAG